MQTGRATGIKLLLALLPLFVGCGNPSLGTDTLTPKKVREQAVTIAILPERNVFEQKKRYKPLAEYLSEKVNVNVRIKLLDSYGSIHHEITNQTIDGAFLGSFNYVLNRTRTDLEAVARPVEKGGSSGYRGVIFTRKDSGLTSDVQTWRGKKIALVHKVTMAGYVFPVWHLNKQGIQDLNNYFSKIVFLGSHDAAVLAVFKGQADMGAAKDIILQKMLAENAAMKDEIVILTSSVSVPSNTLCLRSGLQNGIKDSLKKSLLSMHDTAGGKAALQALNAVKFIEATDSEFEVLRRMADDIDLDIRSPFWDAK